MKTEIETYIARLILIDALNTELPKYYPNSTAAKCIQSEINDLMRMCEEDMFSMAADQLL